MGSCIEKKVGWGAGSGQDGFLKFLIRYLQTGTSCSLPCISERLWVFPFLARLPIGYISIHRDLHLKYTVMISKIFCFPLHDDFLKTESAGPDIKLVGHYIDRVPI